MFQNFIFNDEFRNHLRENAHHYGEVTFLESVLHPGMSVIEGGANRGVTTIATAKAVGEKGHVYAFEPVPEFFSVLQKNISANAIQNVSAHNLALFNRNGTLSFYKHGEGSGITPADDGEPTEVQAITIPAFLNIHKIPKVDFLNLDCEGSELLIFRNIHPLLADQSPAIFCEIHHGYLNDLGQSVHDIADFFETVGYKVTPLEVEDLESKVELDDCSHIYASNGNQ